MADVTVTGKMYKSKDGTKRGIKVKVCNETDHDIDIKLADKTKHSGTFSVRIVPMDIRRQALRTTKS